MVQSAQSKIFAVKRGSAIQLRKRSGLFFPDCAARIALQNFAVRKALPRACITAGRRSLWKLERSGWQVIRHAKPIPVSYTHLRAHETDSYLVCRLLLEK